MSGRDNRLPGRDRKTLSQAGPSTRIIIEGLSDDSDETENWFSQLNNSTAVSDPKPSSAPTSARDSWGFRQSSSSTPLVPIPHYQYDVDSNLTIPEPQVADPVMYNKYLEADRRIRERSEMTKSGLRGIFNRLKNKGRVVPPLEGNPYERVLPKTASGKTAVYGEHHGLPVHGPADWHQWYTQWDQVGQDYLEPDPNKRGHFIDQSTGISISLQPFQVKYLKGKGFTFEKFLGKGSFGQVWKVKQDFIITRHSGRVDVNKPLACKILSLKTHRDQSLKSAVDKLCREAQVYENLIHPNIVHRTEIINILDEKSGFPQPIHILLMMELMEGDLHSLLHPKSYDPIDMQQFLKLQIKSGWIHNPEMFTHKWVKQIVCGLRYLHELNIAHLDIKPGNILFVTHMQSGQTRYIFKLTDFGLAVKFGEGQPAKYRGKVTTTTYAAPECFDLHHYDPKIADIYSLGASIAHSIGGNDTDQTTVMNAIITNNQNELQRLKISDGCIKLVQAMIEADPQKRKDIFWVEQNNWLQSFRDS